MPFPVGRVGLRDFLAITGISRTLFFESYRWDEAWIEYFDICLDEMDHLNMDERAARRFAAARKGRKAIGRSSRVNNLGVAAQTRPCPSCAEQIKVLAKICKHCGCDVSEV